MKKYTTDAGYISFVLSLCFLFSGCNNSGSDNDSPTRVPPQTINTPIDRLFLATSKLGGETSIENISSNAFSKPAVNLAADQRASFEVGDSLFAQAWVSAPATTTARDGLGPFFNTNACQSCHIKDGRGHAPLAGETDATSLLLRISIDDSHPQASDEAILKNINGEAAVIPHPLLGGQIQDKALIGLMPEASFTTTYETSLFTYADGHTTTLRKPIFTLFDDAGLPITNLLVSPRIAPVMIGLGLIEAINETDILDQEDSLDANNDGISGKVNHVWNVAEAQSSIGRFGWKAGQPSLNQQNAGAFNGDMGLTSHLFPTLDCTVSQTSCVNAQNAGATHDDLHEVTPEQLAFVELYTRHLAVPERRNKDDAVIIDGYRLFKQLNCHACHTISYTTGDLDNAPALSQQVIFPFTDLLLHDMGEGLADNRSEFLANGQEWRTPPLWGIGLTTIINNGHHPDGFLHDGRAETIEHAILWHGGEATDSQTAFSRLTKDERDTLLLFLHSL